MGYRQRSLYRASSNNIRSITVVFVQPYLLQGYLDASTVRFPLPPRPLPPPEFGLLIKQQLYFDRYTKILAPTLDPLRDSRIQMQTKVEGEKTAVSSSSSSDKRAADIPPDGPDASALEAEEPVAAAAADEQELSEMSTTR